MTNAEMITVLKMAGWRLRSKVDWPDTRKRRWYITEGDEVLISPRKSKHNALMWGIAMLTDDRDLQLHLRTIDIEERLGKWSDV